jgi:cell division protein ZapB
LPTNATFLPNYDRHWRTLQNTVATPQYFHRINYLQSTSMANSSQIEQVTEKVERLLLRYEELRRTNALLAAQVEAISAERDSLKSRLSAARSRVDALLERLPDVGHKESV